MLQLNHGFTPHIGGILHARVYHNILRFNWCFGLLEKQIFGRQVRRYKVVKL